MPPTPHRIELTDPDAYIAKLTKLLGNRDPLEVLAQTPIALGKIVDQVPAETLRCRPFPDKWTPNEILGHLADTEWVFGYRTRTIAFDDHPAIVGIDQEKWVSIQHHNDREPADLLDEFRTLRQRNLRFWKTITPDQRQRTYQHNERGQETLAVQLTIIPGHDLSHLDQLRRYLAAIDAPDRR